MLKRDRDLIFVNVRQGSCLGVRRILLLREHAAAVAYTSYPLMFLQARGSGCALDRRILGQSPPIGGYGDHTHRLTRYSRPLFGL